MGKIRAVLGGDGKVSREDFVDVVEDRGFREVRHVVLLTQVCQGNASCCWGAHFSQKLTCLVVRQMATASRYPILERVGVRAVHQFVVVVIGFDGDVLARG